MGSPPQRTAGKWGEDGEEGRGGDGGDRVGECGLCTGVVVCVGGTVASMGGQVDFISSPLLLLFQILLLLEGTRLHHLFTGHGGVAACPVLPQGGSPLWITSTGVLQALKQKRNDSLSLDRWVGVR